MEDPVIAQRQNEQIQQHSDAISNNPEEDRRQKDADSTFNSNSIQSDPASIFSDLPLSALTATSTLSSANPTTATSNLNLPSRPLSGNAASISTSSSSTSASASPSSSPNVSRSSSIGQAASIKGGGGGTRIRPGLLSRAGTDPDRDGNNLLGNGSPSNGIRPLSSISKGMPSNLFDGNPIQSRNLSSGGGGTRDRRNVGMRSTSASEDDEARLSDSGIIPRRFADQSSPLSSTLNVSASTSTPSVSSAPAATTSMNHHQQSQRSSTATSTYSGYSASSSRNSSPLVSPAGSISAARARQVFASPTSSPISSTNAGLPPSAAQNLISPSDSQFHNPQYYYPNEPGSAAGGHVSEASSKSGSASLGRAQSVSSVSSVNSTSSLEAAPFRAAPLGNFRVGFGGYGSRPLGGYGNHSTANNSNRRPQMMQRDKTLSGGNQIEKNASRAGMAIGTGGESSAAESEDGGNEPSNSNGEKKFAFPNRTAGSSNSQPQAQSVGIKGKQREGLPLASSPEMPFGFDSVATSNQEPNPSNENGVPPSPISRKQAHTPKLPSDAWQYRNAPGMGGSRHNSSIPASWGLSAASGAAPSGHHRGSNSFSIPQSNTWSVGSSPGMEGSVKTIDLGNEEPLVSSVSNSQSPSRKHQNSSSLRSKIVKSASKLGIKPLTASSTTTGGSGGSSPSMNGSRPFIQLEGEALPESPGVLRIDTAASVPSISTGTGGLLVPSIVGTPLSAGTLSSHSGDSTLGLAGLVGVVPSINSQDESLPMSRTSSVTNAPLFVAKHGEGAGANFNSGGASPLPSPGIPAYVNTSKNAFGVWAFGVPEPRVSPKEEREKLGPISSSSSNLSTSPAALRSIGALSPSSLAAIAPSSPLRTPNSALAPSSPSLSNSKALNSTPPLAAQSSPETPSTPLSRINATSNGNTPNPSRKKSAPLTPAQQVQAEVEAGTARAPSEPSGHTPGPTPVLPPGSSSSRDRSGRNRSSHRDRERERGSSKEAQDQVRKGHHHHQSSSTSQPLSTSPIETPSTGSDPIASSFQSTSRNASKTRERQRTNSSNLRLQPIPSSDLIPFKRRDSSTPFPASAPTSPLLEASKFNLHKQSNSTSSGGSHGTEASSTATTSRGRMSSSKDVGNSPIKIPQRPSFLRALTSDSVFSNKSAGGKSYRSRNDSVLSGEGSWGSGSTSKPTGRREEDAKGPSALARESKTKDEEEEENQEGRDDDESEMPSELKSKDQDSKNPFKTATNGTSRNVEPDRESFKQDLAAADSLIAERRAPIVENSINMPAAVESRVSEANNPSPASNTQVLSSINPSPNASLSSPHGSSFSGSKSSDQPPASSFGPSEVQAKVEAQAQSEVSPPRSESFFVPPQFTRADTAISSTSNAISTSSNSIAPASIKAPVRKIPGVYIPHADSSQVGNSPGKIHPLQNSDNRAHHVEGTPTSNSPSSISSSNPSNPSPPATTSVAPSTPAPHLALPTSSTNSQSPATPISPRTARGPKDFEFGEILGEGSYSTVLEAWDLLSGPSTTLDGSQAVQSTTAAAAAAGKTPTSSATAARAGRKIYAVKVLDKMHILKEKKQKYVNVEREALSLLVKHPGVISLYWTFQDRESLYFVLQLAQNGELLSFIKKHGSFDPFSSRYYAAQLIDTIGAMHRVGVIHRDIKPENVLLDGAMRIKVTDFGSAKISKPKSSTTSTSPAAPPPTTSEPAGAVRERANSFVGTAEYVSPELLGGKAAAEASDFWAFGCVLYQMIAGRPPFKGANEYQTFQKIIKREFEYPEDFPSDARDLVDRLLVLDPEKRLGFEGGVEEIKKHAFFSEVDFNTIWSIPAPSISTGIYQRPAPSITRRSETNSLFGSDGWADTREAGSLLSQGNSSQAASTGNAADDSRAASVSSLEQGSSSAAPGRSTTSVADADDSDSDAQAGPSRPRGLSTGEVGASGANGKRASNLLRLASAVTGKEWSATVGSKSNRNSQRASVIPPNVRQQLKHRFSFNEVNGSSSSVDDFDQDDTPTRGGVPARRRHGSALAPAPASSSSPATPSSTSLTPVVGWAGLLLPHEVLLYACPVVHRKTGTANMFSKKRQLILTDFPRLLCVKETADALKVKSEVILAMPQLVPSTSQTSDVLAPLPIASQPAELFPTTPSQGTPSRFEAKRRASHSAGIDDQQAHSNDSPVSPRGIPARRESWSANSLAAERGQQASSVRGISPDPDRERARAFLRANANAAPNMLIGVEARGNRAFVVHTPARSYLYEDPSGDSSNWIKVINSARGS